MPLFSAFGSSPTQITNTKQIRRIWSSLKAPFPAIAIKLRNIRPRILSILYTQSRIAQLRKKAPGSREIIARNEYFSTNTPIQAMARKGVAKVDKCTEILSNPRTDV
jgi:hypothetical protein